MTPSFTAVDALTEERAVVLIPTDRLRPHPHNPRRDVGDISDLTADVAARGIDSPLTVVDDGVPDPGFDYLVVIGHRRHAAALAAGLPRVPCIVRDLTPAEQLAMMLRENVHRSDLTVVEEADAIQGLLDLGLTVDEVARDVARSESTVRRRMRLAIAPEPARAAIHGGQATLEQWDQVLATADGDDELVKRLAATMGTRDFDFEVRTVERERAHAAAVAAVNAWLAERSIQVIGYRDARAGTHRQIGNVDGNRLLRGEDAPSVEGLTDVVAYAYTDEPAAGSEWYYLAAPRPQEEQPEAERRAEVEPDPEREARLARHAEWEAARVRARQECDTAHDTRAAFLAGLLNRKALAKDDLWVICTLVSEILAFDSVSEEYTEANAAEALGLGELVDQARAEAEDLEQDPDAVDEYEVLIGAYPKAIGDIGGPIALVRLIASAVEPNIGPNGWLNGYRADARVRTYYRLLQALGYERSTVELAALDRGQAAVEQ